MWGGSGNDDPFKEIENFFRRISGPGSHFSSGSFSRSLPSGGSFESTSRGSIMPAASIADTGSQYQLEIDVPGIQRDDLKVTATPQKLCVSGQRRPVFESGHTPEPGAVMLDERGIGFFERCFSFPTKINESAVVAQHANGVLSISVGHSGSDPSKQIIIK
jgi:HSP20 family protein